MVERIVPASADHCTSRNAQDRFVPQVEVIAVMPVVTIDPAGTRTDSDIGPFRAIVAHEGAIVDIPGLVMIDKGGGTLCNRSRAIKWAMHERGRRGILAFDMHAVCRVCLIGSRVTENRRASYSSHCRHKQDG